MIKSQFDVDTVKCGKNGIPDRLVIVGPCRHVWFEFKQPGGGLTPAQKRRIPKMRSRGEVVHLIDSTSDALTAVAVHLRKP
jgi:hypothetical protein